VFQKIENCNTPLNKFYDQRKEQGQAGSDLAGTLLHTARFEVRKQKYSTGMAKEMNNDLARVKNGSNAEFGGPNNTDCRLAEFVSFQDIRHIFSLADYFSSIGKPV
jgi:hypothetical protein